MKISRLFSLELLHIQKQVFQNIIRHLFMYFIIFK
jgi:hypothetical protein